MGETPEEKKPTFIYINTQEPVVYKNIMNKIKKWREFAIL